MKIHFPKIRSYVNNYLMYLYIDIYVISRRTSSFPQLPVGVTTYSVTRNSSVTC